MRAFRRRLPFIALLGLLIQLSGSALSALAFCCASPAAVSAKDDHECCKGLGPGQVCPLHGKAAAPSAPATGHEHGTKPKAPEGGCAMKSACNMPDLALLSMLGTAILVAPISLSVELESAPLALVSTSPLARDLVPETPPPRA